MPHRLPQYTRRPRGQLDRVLSTLTRIEQTLDEPFSVESLAACQAVSRWQLQRGFQAEMGIGVASYARARRLGQAARELIASERRQIDIALDCGFGSEISFHRAFRSHFGCSPGRYRRIGALARVQMPTRLVEAGANGEPYLLPMRLESRSGFQLRGISGTFHGLLSACPDFSVVVPDLWQRLHGVLPQAGHCAVGVVDNRASADQLTYWAAMEGVDADAQLTTLQVPAQSYLAIAHRGSAGALHRSVECALTGWGRWVTEGFELEIYDPSYDTERAEGTVEYWLPLAPKAWEHAAF